MLSFYEWSIVKQCTALWQTCYGSNFVLSHLLPCPASTVTCECQSGKPYTVELAPSLLFSLCLILGGSFVHRLDPSSPFYMRQKVLSKTPPTDTCLNLFLPSALGHLVNGKTVMKREKGKKPEMKWSPQHVWSLQQKQEGRASSFLLRFLPHRSCSDLWEAYTVLKTHEVITFRLDVPLSEMKDWSHGSSAYIVYNFLPPGLHFV